MEFILKTLTSTDGVMAAVLCALLGAMINKTERDKGIDILQMAYRHHFDILISNSPYAKNRTFGLSESPGEEVS